MVQLQFLSRPEPPRPRSQQPLNRIESHHQLSKFTFWNPTEKPWKDYSSRKRSQSPNKRTTSTPMIFHWLSSTANFEDHQQKLITQCDHNCNQPWNVKLPGIAYEEDDTNNIGCKTKVNGPRIICHSENVLDEHITPDFNSRLPNL